MSSSVLQRTPSAYVLLLAVVLGIAHIAIAMSMSVPIIHGDEAGYLGNATQILRGFGRTGEGYYAGYSLFLIPAATLDEPLSYYTFALLSNAALAVGAFVALYRLARCVFSEAPRGQMALAAFVASVLPAPMMLSAVAMADNALLLIVPLIALGIAEAERRGNASLWVLVSILAGFASWTNPRGVIVTLAYALGAAASFWAVRRIRRWIAVVIAPTFATLMLGRLFNAVVAGEGSAPGTRPTELADAVARLVDVAQWPSVLAFVAGRVSYLVVASAGLALVGLWWLVRGSTGAARSHSAFGPPPAGVSVFLAIGAATTVVLSAVSFAREPFTRLDYVIYGRYSEIFLPTLAVIGIAAVMARLSRRGRVKAGFVVVGVAIGAAVIMRYARPPLEPNAVMYWLNVPGLFWVRDFVEPIYLSRMLLVGALATAAAWVVIASYRLVGIIAVGLGFAVASYFVVTDYAIAGSASREDQTVLARQIETLDGRDEVHVSCIAVDWPGVSFFHVRQYQFLLARIEFVDASWPESDECDLIVSSRLDLDQDEQDAVVVGTENHFPVRLWLRLGRYSDDQIRMLDLDGMYYDAVPPVDVQDSAMYRATVRARNVAVLDGRVVGEIEITHAGAESPWLGSFGELGSGAIGRVQIVAALLDGGGDVVDEWRIPLASSLLPSETAVALVDHDLDDDAGDSRLQLRIGLVQEGVTAFDTQGGSVALIELRP